ncbi:MAG: methyl-accepting chemotaxis protein [Actinomycetota bacterium]
MRALRLLALIIIGGLVAVGVVLDERDRDLTELDPPVLVSTADSRTGTWFCAGGSGAVGSAAVGLEIVNAGTDDAAAEVQLVLDGVDTIPQLRQAADAFGPATEIIPAYTAINNSMIDVVAAAAWTSGISADLARQVTAYTAFLTAKERSGLERARGAQAFGPSVPLTAARQSQYAGLVAEQRAFLDVFESLATDDILELWETIQDDASFTQVLEWRHLLIDSGDRGGWGVDSGEWFDVITDKIDQLKIVEDAQAVRIIDSADVVSNAYRNLLLVGAAAVLLLAGIAVVVTRSITSPLRRVTEQAAALAVGRTDVSSEVVSKDELGQLAGSMDDLRSHLAEHAAAAARIAAGDLRTRTEPRSDQDVLGTAMNEMTSRLHEIIVKLVDRTEHLAGASNGLHAVSSTLAGSAATTAERASTTATTAGDISQSIGVVSDSTTQLQSSVHEIATAVREVSDVATRAASLAAASGDNVAALSASSDAIGDVVELISQIAERTHRLALNATIEAARAGSAGRGFAVVADEVKNLASQTAEATSQISKRVADIQAVSTTTTAALDEMGTVIESVSGRIGEIAAAVDQQSDATSTIAASVSAVSTNADRISIDVETVAGGASETNDAVRDIDVAVTDLAQISTELDEFTGSFVTA